MSKTYTDINPRADNIASSLGSIFMIVIVFSLICFSLSSSTLPFILFLIGLYIVCVILLVLVGGTTIFFNN